jgi:hypothetical protein
VNAAELVAIYTGSDAEFQRVSDRVERRLKKTSTDADRATKEVSQAYDRAGKGIESLFARLPGGQYLSGIKSLAGDIGDVASAANVGGESLTGMAGSG